MTGIAFSGKPEALGCGGGANINSLFCKGKSGNFRDRELGLL
jgi:hypothetical protein